MKTSRVWYRENGVFGEMPVPVSQVSYQFPKEETFVRLDEGLPTN